MRPLCSLCPSLARLLFYNILTIIHLNDIYFHNINHFSNRLLRYLTGYHTERKPTRRTVTKTTSTSIASTLTG